MRARINLAPEVYQTNQKNKQRKKFATTVAVWVNLAALGAIVAMIVIIGGQKITVATLQGQIDDKKQQLRQIPDLQKAVTAQEHLASWKQLSTDKAYLSKFFLVAQEFTPQGLAFSSLSIGDGNIIEVSASAKTYALATKFAKALQAANVEIGSNASKSDPKPYFSDVKLDAVSDSGSGTVDFKITATVASEVTSGN